MAPFNPENLHVEIDQKLNKREALLPRKYTLTHSDATGDLFLKIGITYDEKEISGWYTRLMRDEVLAEWVESQPLQLHLHLHVSGGLVLGPAKWRASIFRQHLPLVLQAICFGDSAFINRSEACLNAPILVHFHASRAKFDKIENWGIVKDHCLSGKPHQS